MYQQDIFDWNDGDIAEKMNNLEFKYTISPGSRENTSDSLSFLDKPMSFEKDEIALRNKFYYQEAYFYKSKSLKQ